jgi:hypothetical protein
MRKFFGTIAAIALVAVSAQSSSAQGFSTGYLDIGPVIGLGGIGDGGISIGGRLEKAIKPLESLGGGMLGIQAGADIYSYDVGGYDWSFISIGATANYHFKMTDTKFDPFIGLGLGFHVFSCDAEPIFGIDPCGDNGGIYFIGRAGVRYFLSEKLAAYGDIGAGAATFNLGVMLRLK